MKASFYYGIGDLRLEETDVPAIHEEELLIKVKTCAVCGTDLRIYKYGHFKIPPGTKRVLGHEVAGEIVAAGSKVKGYQVGMRVAVPPNVGCGTCPLCIQGYNQLCPDYEAFGISLDGGFQEYLKIPARAIAAGNVVPIPDGVSFEEATLTEPLSCCFHTYQALKTAPGDTVLIVGAGPIGALHVMLSSLAGAAQIIVADLSRERLREIEKYGAGVTLHSEGQDLVAAVKRVTQGWGADVVITACSVPEIQRQALHMAAPRGRISFFGGLPQGKEEVLLNTNLIHYKELVVLATTGSSLSDYYKSMQIVASRKIDIRSLVSATYPIAETAAAFQYTASGRGMKALVTAG